MNRSRTSASIEGIHNTQDGFHCTVGNTSLEGLAGNIQDGCSRRFRTCSGRSGDCNANDFRLRPYSSAQCQRTRNEWSKSLVDGKTLSHRSIDEIHKIRMIIDSESIAFHRLSATRLSKGLRTDSQLLLYRSHFRLRLCGTFSNDDGVGSKVTHARKWLKSCFLDHAIARLQLSSVGSETT